MLIKLQEYKKCRIIQNNSETNEKKMLREKYISPELRQKIIDDLKLKEENSRKKLIQ